jgi:adenylosuccinate lyase
MSLSYESPLKGRYASPEMNEVFSSRFKYRNWRKLWVALAEAQKELGLSITQDQIDEMKANIDQINFDEILTFEKETRHEVMAHILSFGKAAPSAKGIIHMGATSSYVMDNGDLISLKAALKLIKGKLALLIEKLNHLSLKEKETPCIGYTHLQVAQATTFGKRVCLYLQDFLTDFKDLLHLLNDFPFLGCKGAIGTQNSFLSLFDGDHQKVIKLDDLITKKMGFNRSFLICSQTYPRKQEQRVLSLLSSISSSAYKCAGDIRLLSSFGEVEEPFKEKSQVGSSAMPYKRNPIYSERVCGLSRFVKNIAHTGADNASEQWLERSLDDSSNRRLCIPEAFLGVDSVLNLLYTIISGLKVFPKVMEARLNEHLPYISTETILAAAVLKRHDRQEAHEKIRKKTFEASLQKKETGKAPEFLQSLLETFDLKKEDLSSFLELKNLTGRAKEQTVEFLKLEVEPILEEHLDLDTLIPSVEF